MTKTIRVENADTSDWKVNVEVWDETANGPVLVKTVYLDHPTAMTQDLYITSTRYLVIKEFGPGSKSRLRTLEN